MTSPVPESHSSTPFVTPRERDIAFDDDKMMVESLYDDEMMTTTNDRRNRRQRDSYPGFPRTSSKPPLWRKKRFFVTLLIVASGITVASVLGTRAYEDGHAKAVENHRIGMALCENYPALPYCLKIRDAVDPYNGALRSRFGLVSIVNQTTPMYATQYSTLEHGATSGNASGLPSLIHKLIIDAEEQWNAKVAKQSRSLEQAVAEYKRRYNQNPPLGFDQWYNFAVENNVKLIDEYDQIYADILPYASVPSGVLRERSDMLQEDENLWVHDLTFTIDVTNHTGSLEGPMTNSNSRAEKLLLLMQGFIHLLPDLNLTATGHDAGYIVVSGEARERHVAAAKSKSYISEDDQSDFNDDRAFDGWAKICPPSSTIRNVPRLSERLDVIESPQQVTFIEDHKAAMDVCNHPENQPLHRYTSWEGPRPALLFPLFAFSTTSMHNDLLLPALEQWEVPSGADPVWADKKRDKMIWRGTPTNLDVTNEHDRKNSQRPRLIKFGDQDGNVTVHLSLHDNENTVGPTTPYSVSARELAADYFDFALVGDATKDCPDSEMEACKKFQATHRFAPFMSREEQNQYKYTIDIDGNGWSGRFHTLMSSNSLVLKATIRPEWYMDRIQPWYHYVPVNVDYNVDLFNVMAFFKGDLDGKGAHDALAEKIAKQGSDWSANYWRWEDMQAYLFRLLLEYNRVMQRDPHNYTSHDYLG